MFFAQKKGTVVNMKKSLLFLILAFMTAIIFTGCFPKKSDTLDTGTPEVKIPTTGAELDELAETKLAKLDSYTGIQTLNANMTISGIEFSILSTSKNRVSGQRSDIYSALTESTLITDYTNPQTHAKEIGRASWRERVCLSV